MRKCCSHAPVGREWSGLHTAANLKPEAKSRFIICIMACGLILKQPAGALPSITVKPVLAGSSPEVLARTAVQLRHPHVTRAQDRPSQGFGLCCLSHSLEQTPRRKSERPRCSGL